MKTTMGKFFTSLEALFGAFLGAALSFISPIAPFFWLAIGLVILDTVTGIIAARKRKEKINSRGFARLLSKIVVYMASIMACRGVEQVLHVPNVTYLAVGAIALTELMSVLENTRVVSGANVAGVVGGLLSKFQKVPEQDEEKEK
jgi:phage-related holin